MTVAELAERMTLSEYLDWLDFFKPPPERGAEDMTPAEIAAAFGVPIPEGAMNGRQ
jgi:hypothetical protein